MGSPTYAITALDLANGKDKVLPRDGFMVDVSNTCTGVSYPIVWQLENLHTLATCRFA